jgi:hypothetical protein
VYVDGHLADRFRAGRADHYEVSQLWPATRYSVVVVLTSLTGAQVASYSGSFTTDAATGSFPRLFSPSSFINTQIGSAPAIDPNSNAMIAQAITAYASNSNLSNNNDWGIPIVTAQPQSNSYNVGCLEYWCNVNFGNVHIPSSATPQTGDDAHLAVIQPNGGEMDMWTAQHTNGTWTAGERWLTSTTGPAVNCSLVHKCGGANVAHFALAAGVIRPEEIAQGHIDHALVITTPDTRANYIACPAISTDGTHTNPDSLPIGAHLQLDPNLDINSLNIPTWQKTIATALQKYGAYVVDTGGSVALYAQSNLNRPFDAWAKAGLSANDPNLHRFPWQHMRVLSMPHCGH